MTKKLIIISGLSGAGKSQVLNILEDTGYFCVDNLPVELLDKFIFLVKTTPKRTKFGIGMDIRSAENVDDLIEVYNQLSKKIYNIEILKIFLEADLKTLLKRFSETRRKHPLGGDLLTSIKREQKLLNKVKKLSDVVIDTSLLSIPELQKKIFELIEKKHKKKLRINVLSFGYKFGLPLNADIVFDTRFLPNPNYISGLKMLNGRNKKVKHFILNSTITLEYLKNIKNLLQFILPYVISEGKSYFTLAFGCTGGQHRSVVIAEEIYSYLNFLKKEYKYDYLVSLSHRDI
ncbi:MAG: RNase adapter RapZ [Endomicrobiia bacterium]